VPLTGVRSVALLKTRFSSISMTDESQHGILKQNFLSLLSQHVGHLLDGSFKELKGKPMQEEFFVLLCLWLCNSGRSFLGVWPWRWPTSALFRQKYCLSQIPIFLIKQNLNNET